MIPQVAAGNNLNIPIVGSILRGAGAVFMRRTTRTTTVHNHAHNHEKVGAQLPTSKAHNRERTTSAHNLRAQPAHNRAQKIFLNTKQ